MNVGQSIDIYASSILADSSPSRLLRITRNEDDYLGDSKYVIAPFSGSNTYNVVWDRLVLIMYPVEITSTLNNIEGSRSLTAGMDIAGPFGPGQISMFSEKIIFDYMYPFLISCSPDIGHVPFVGGTLEFLDE